MLALAMWLWRRDLAERRRRALNDLLRPEGVCILGGECLTGNVLWSIEALRARLP